MTDFIASRCCRFLALREKYYPDVIIDFGLGYAEELQYFKRYWRKSYIIGLEPCAITKPLRVHKLYRAVVANTTFPIVPFYERGRSETSSLYPTTRGRKWHKTEVRQIKLDELLLWHKLENRKVLLWMDCEGSELDALLGGLKLLKYCNWIYTEVNSIIKYPHGTNSRTVLEVLEPFLFSRGFKLTKRFGRKRRVHTRLYRNCNTLSR